ncbi:hypothetical protein B7R22_17590 [Subtercola boreus]|uniref:Ferredoxin-NADPH reductase n=1 Tax=Subtercola boreus TaxID=120213 RepID=A0A3E0VSH5_9MICO|nr:DUF624 domain-containing protein [Subtercola boreus]RFA11827.1 hypothetical protein B7R22_17590 [Subtercola boreus]
MAKKRGMMVFGTETYERIFRSAYQGLVTNLLLLVFGLPLVVGFTVIEHPLVSWPFLLALSLPCAPAVAAAFASFSESRREDEVRPVRQFVAGLRHVWLRALLVWAVAVVAIVVIGVDATVLQATSAGSLLAPALIILSGLVVVLTFNILVGVGEFSDVRLSNLLKWSFLLAVRQWYFGLITVAMLGCISVAFIFQPVVGILVTPAFLFFVIWANTRQAFDRLLDPRSATVPAK